MFLVKSQAKKDGFKRTHAQVTDYNSPINLDSGQSVPTLNKKAPAARGLSENMRF